MADDSNQLLGPLDDAQQTLIDVVASSLRTKPVASPIFDYVDGTLENMQPRLDAWAILQSFPRLTQPPYSAVSYEKVGQIRPPADSPVALTILGIDRSAKLKLYNGNKPVDFVAVFLAAIKAGLHKRRSEQPDPTTPRVLKISESDVLALIPENDRSAYGPGISRFLYDVIEREPPFRGEGTVADEGWFLNVPRELLRFEGVETIEDYVACLQSGVR